MNFGDLVLATSPETGMFYGIYAGESRCWKYCDGVQELTDKNIIWCTSIKMAEGFLGGNWFEQQAERIKVGYEVWCSDSSYKTAIEKPHTTFVVIDRGEKGYRTVAVEDVENYNKGHQVGIIPWAFAVPTGRKVGVNDSSVKKNEEEPILKGDRVICVAGSCDVDEGEIYEILEGEKEDSRFVEVLTRRGGQLYYPWRFKKIIVPKGYEPKFQPGDLVECIEGNYFFAKGSFYRVVTSYPYPKTGTRFVTIKRPDGTEIEAYECRFVLVPKEDRWSFEITNGAQVNGSEITENLTRKKPIIYHTGVVEGKAFFDIHNSFIFKWQQLEGLWDEAHRYLTIVRDYGTYRRYITDLSNIDKLLHIFRAVKKRPWPADGYGRRKVEVFQPVL